MMTLRIGNLDIANIDIDIDIDNIRNQICSSNNVGGRKNDDLANREAMEAVRNNGANVTANSKAAYQTSTILDAHMRSIWGHRTPSTRWRKCEL